MGIKDWFISNGMKQMLKSQLKDVPEAERDRIIGMIEKNPDFFMKVAEDIQERVKAGKNQMSAAMEVMKENEAEFKKMM